jgi:hypothetical protein
MPSKASGQGNKTHEQFRRTLERKDDIADPQKLESAGNPSGSTRTQRADSARQSEMPVSHRGMNQESRDHNKHNDPGQSGHKPQKHRPAEEKH